MASRNRASTEVWHQEFSFMKFRQKSQHSVCAVCTRHKLLIRNLGAHLLARKEQVRKFTEHLRAQYRDRLEYWSLRGVSRLRSSFQLTCIIDSMDQAKFGLPRSEVCRAKDLSTFVRPKCHLTAIIMHGHGVFLAISKHDMPKNSSVMIELLSHALTEISKTGYPMQQTRLCVQADNTVREMKNNHFLKQLGSLTSHGGGIAKLVPCEH